MTDDYLGRARRESIIAERDLATRTADRLAQAGFEFREEVGVEAEGIRRQLDMVVNTGPGLVVLDFRSSLDRKNLQNLRERNLVTNLLVPNAVATWLVIPDDALDRAKVQGEDWIVPESQLLTRLAPASSVRSDAASPLEALPPGAIAVEVSLFGVSITSRFLIPAVPATFLINSALGVLAVLSLTILLAVLDLIVPNARLLAALGSGVVFLAAASALLVRLRPSGKWSRKVVLPIAKNSAKHLVAPVIATVLGGLLLLWIRGEP